MGFEEQENIMSKWLPSEPRQSTLGVQLCLFAKDWPARAVGMLSQLKLRVGAEYPDGPHHLKTLPVAQRDGVQRVGSVCTAVGKPLSVLVFLTVAVGARVPTPL